MTSRVALSAEERMLFRGPRRDFRFVLEEGEGVLDASLFTGCAAVMSDSD